MLILQVGLGEIEVTLAAGFRLEQFLGAPVFGLGRVDTRLERVDAGLERRRIEPEQDVAP